MLLTEQSLFNQDSSKCNNFPKNTTAKITPATIADSIVQMLKLLGVQHAFGIGGGAIATIWEALEQSSIEVLHFRHEAGAAFAAMEAYFADDYPVAVFTTTGPGITNVLTGIAAARWEGAKVILISASTSTKLQGKWAFQETTINTMPKELFTSGSLFHYAHSLKSSDELPEIAQKLAAGLQRPGGFVAHLSIATDIQIGKGCDITIPTLKSPLFIPDNNVINKAIELLSSEPFAIWVGFGARNASKEILQLAEKTGAAVMSSPRGKGIFPETHPQYVGVTGFAGHQSVFEYMQAVSPKRILVLGTRLGEFTSFWNPAMVPSCGFIHVDIDPLIPGTAYPTAETFPVIADIKAFLSMLLEKLPQKLSWSPVTSLPHPNNLTSAENVKSVYTDFVRPNVLMDAIQEVIIEGSDAIIIAEAGNSFAWTTHHLKFHQGKNWRVSTGFGAMGNATTGVLGAAIAGYKAVAIVGDGAMLMNNEINTAVQYQIPAIWIILNDANYSMCYQGMNKLGYTNAKTHVPSTDFVMLARSMGAEGIFVESEYQLKIALIEAMNSKVPFVVDVKIDPTKTAPIGARINSLNK